MKREYLLAIIILLALVNILLLKQNHTLKKSLGNNVTNISYLKGNRAPNFILYDNKGTEYNSNLLFNSNRFNLMFIFNLKNCALCNIDRKIFSQLKLRKKICILGIVDHENRKEFNTWVENENLPFPILFDEDGIVTKSFGAVDTPLFVLTDEKGLIIYKSTASSYSLQFMAETYIQDLE